MIAINLTPAKNILKLALLATSIHLLFNITSNYNIVQYRTPVYDTVVIDPIFLK